MTYLNTSGQAKTWTQNWCAGMTDFTLSKYEKSWNALCIVGNCKDRKGLKGWGSTKNVVQLAVTCNSIYWWPATDKTDEDE